MELNEAVMFKADCRDLYEKHQTLQFHDCISHLIKFNIRHLLHDQQNIGLDLNGCCVQNGNNWK